VEKYGVTAEAQLLPENKPMLFKDTREKVVLDEERVLWIEDVEGLGLNIRLKIGKV
jgi:hypothetical protein